MICTILFDTFYVRCWSRELLFTSLVIAVARGGYTNWFQTDLCVFIVLVGMLSFTAFLIVSTFSSPNLRLLCIFADKCCDQNGSFWVFIRKRCIWCYVMMSTSTALLIKTFLSFNCPWQQLNINVHVLWLVWIAVARANIQQYTLRIFTSSSFWLVGLLWDIHLSKLDILVTIYM